VTPGQRDAARARAAGPPASTPPSRRGAAPVPPRTAAVPPAAEPGAAAPQPAISPERAGERIRSYWNAIAQIRGYKKIHPRDVEELGTAALAIAEKRGINILLQFPEVLFLLVLGPYLLSAVIAEVFTRGRGGPQQPPPQPAKTPPPAPPPPAAPPAQRPTGAERPPVYDGGTIMS